MTEYCSILVNESWEPDIHPNVVVEYELDDGSGDIHHIDYLAERSRPHSRDHLSSLSSPPRLQLTRQHSDGSESDESSSHCQITLQCKPVYSVNITGFWVVSEARTVEVYDARDASYLQTVRGTKDKEDSEADNSRVHFKCRCALDRPLGGITVKFLSLGQRESFEIAHIMVIVEACSTQNLGNQAMSRPTVNMDKLRQDVDDMGDSVSDRAKAFFTTLENFQKSKHGAVDDLRYLLLDKNISGNAGQSMMGITTLLSMFASSPGMGSITNTTTQSSGSNPTEGSMMNHMLTQMMSSLAMGSGGGGGGEKRVGEATEADGDMYKFLQSVCGQVSQQRAEDEAQAKKSQDASAGLTEGVTGKGDGDVRDSSELESRVTAQVEAMVESRLSEVEEQIKQQVDQRMDEMETRMTGKLDAIFALLQNSQKLS